MTRFMQGQYQSENNLICSSRITSNSQTALSSRVKHLGITLHDGHLDSSQHSGERTQSITWVLMYLTIGLKSNKALSESSLQSLHEANEHRSLFQLSFDINQVEYGWLLALNTSSAQTSELNLVILFCFLDNLFSQSETAQLCKTQEKLSSSLLKAVSSLQCPF